MFEEISDFFKTGFAYYFLIALPIFIICTSSPVLASNEFSVQRMSQFDVNGVSHGCRVSTLNLEAKSLNNWSTNRHCVIAKYFDLTIPKLEEIRQKAGGLVIVLPNNISQLSTSEKEHLLSLEEVAMQQAFNIPVYFTQPNEHMESVLQEINTELTLSPSSQSNANRQPAIYEIFNSISANGYQIVSTGASHSANKYSSIPIIQGELNPLQNLRNSEQDSKKLPVVIITANLNVFGLYNEYGLNSDVAVLFSIMDVFNKLNNIANAAPKYKLMFLISESGSYLNYQGAKKWLDDNSQIQNLDFVICLDTISQSLSSSDNSLFMHVSRPAKEGSPTNKFYNHLQSVLKVFSNKSVDVVHKKINLAENQLAWEHERFSMKRLPAFTLSSVQSYKDQSRKTSFKDTTEEIINDVQHKAKVLSEALARHIYNIEEGEIVSNIDKDVIKLWLGVKSAINSNDIKNGFEKYLKNVKITHDKPANREPEFMLYDGQDAVLNVYRIKPAIFDLFLTVLIAIYLSAIYLVINFFPSLYSIVCQFSKVDKPTKLKSR